MFRYVGLVWDDTGPTTSLTARQLAQHFVDRPAWDAALHRPGLRVFVTGTRPRVNRVHGLPADRGVVLGKLFRRRDLGSPFAPDVELSSSEGDEILRSTGLALVRGFWGRYVAFLCKEDGPVRVLRDPSGSLPCFRIEHGGVTIVFSWLEDVLEMPMVDAPRVNWEAVNALLRLGALGGRETTLVGVSQVLAGELLDLRNDTASFPWRAVDMARSASEDDFDEAALELRDTVRACTRAWAACYEVLLLRLSGGVDSSILASCLAPGATSADVLCVNYHSPGSNSDEREYARLAAVRAGRDLIERERNGDFRIERLSSAARMPFPINYIGWMNAAIDARLASAHSATAMFSGAGGDPLFFEFRRWWPAADYLRSNGVDRGFAGAALDAARLGRVSVWKAAALAVAELAWPRVVARELSSPSGGFFGEALEQHDLQRERFVHPHLVRTDLPVGKHMQAASLMHPIGYYDPFERAAAPELVTPLLSQPLVELSLGLPTFLLTRGGHGRALARTAFASDLPVQIATRRSKGGMEDHLRHVLDANIETARGVLLDGQLVGRGLLDRGAVEAVLSGGPTALPGSLGHIHTFIGIEWWLSRFAL